MPASPRALGSPSVRPGRCTGHKHEWSFTRCLGLLLSFPLYFNILPFPFKIYFLQLSIRPMISEDSSSLGRFEQIQVVELRMFSLLEDH